MLRKSATRFLTLLFATMLYCHAVSAQVNAIHSFNQVVKLPGGWVKVGRIALPQLGEVAVIQFYAGSGFNALYTQNSYVELFIRTSSGTTMQDGFAFSASAAKFGRVTSFIMQIMIVPNAAGLAATAYDVYIFTGNYIGEGIYHVKSSSNASWIHSMVKETPVDGYNVPFEFSTLSDTYLGNMNLFVSSTTGNVGIGTLTPQAKLAVNGDITAKKVKVTLTGWPDYVFAPAYPLLPLKEVASFIKTHQHLPEIPSAREVENQGLDLGSTQAKLLQKIEELTLYLIDQDKKMDTQQELIIKQGLQLKTLEKELQKLRTTITSDSR